MENAFEALENANIPIKGSDMAAGMDEGYIKLLFADKEGLGRFALTFQVYYTHLTFFPHAYYTQVLGNRCCYKHGLWSDQLVSKSPL